jgi:TRAP-type uncharacterized transport system fused permease subunit
MTTTGFAPQERVHSSLARRPAVGFARRTTCRIIPVLIVLAFTDITLRGRHAAGKLTFPGLMTGTMLRRIFHTDAGMTGSAAIITLFRRGHVHPHRRLPDARGCRGLQHRRRPRAGAARGRRSGADGHDPGFVGGHTVATGTVTIPRMKRSGMPARTAAPTGVHIMPPIMGAGAFVMASFTRLPV